MNKVLSFSFNGSKMYTFAGVPDLAAIYTGTNVVECKYANADQSIKELILENSAVPTLDTEQIPMINTDSINKLENYFILEGSVVLHDGNTYIVHISADDTEFYDMNGNQVHQIVTEPQGRYIQDSPSAGVPPQFSPKSLKLTLGTDTSFAGCTIRPKGENKLSVHKVLTSMKEEDLHELYVELVKIFAGKDTKQSSQQSQVTHPSKVQTHQQSHTQQSQSQQNKHKTRLQNPSDDFIKTLAPEVAETLQSVPFSLLQECKASTAGAIDLEALESQGSEYCKANNWHQVDVYFAIDVLKTTERYFYNSATKKVCAVPVSIVQKWRKQLQ